MVISDTVARHRMKAPAPFWQLLFAPESATHPSTEIALQLLTKRGRPLLLLPQNPQLAIRGLELYPAQTSRGRLARSLAGWILRARLPIGVKSLRVNLTPDDSFVRWLAGWAHLAAGEIPQFAVLAGNPNSPGQRFVLLLFDLAGRPVVVVKAGVTQAARELIEQEQHFLESVPRGTAGIPLLRETFTNAKVRALALDFLQGCSPRAADEHKLPQFLRNWLQPQSPVIFMETRAWRELAVTSADHPVFESLAISLRDCSSSGAICHGDFAPWNVRVSPSGDWTALDWERGDLNGLPAWDWFHYTIQPRILVQHQPVARLMAFVETLLADDQFQTYAQAAGIMGNERSLALLYLLYQVEVIRPAEGLATTRNLLEQLAAQWR